MGSIIGVGIFNLPTSLARLRPDQPRVDGPHDRRRGRARAVVRGAVAAACPPTAGRTRTRGSRSGTGSASRTRGRTGSRRGPATPRSQSAGCSTSRCSSTRATTSSARSCSCSSACGSRRSSTSRASRTWARSRSWTTILKFAALAFMSTVGLFYISRANYTPWNISGEGAIGAIGGGMAIALFSYLGVEVAAVAAAKVKDPDRNIPRATIFGTLATAVVYMLSLIACSASFRARTLQQSTAPFSDVGQRDVRRQLGRQRHGDRRHHLRLRRTQRLDHDLRRDAARRRERRTVPRAVQAPVAKPESRPSASSRSTVLASIAMIINYLGSGGATVFTTLVLMTGITAAIPYGVLGARADEVAARRPPRRSRRRASCAT